MGNRAQRPTRRCTPSLANNASAIQRPIYWTIDACQRPSDIPYYEGAVPASLVSSAWVKAPARQTSVQIAMRPWTSLLRQLLDASPPQAACLTGKTCSMSIRVLVWVPVQAAVAFRPKGRHPSTQTALKTFPAWVEVTLVGMR
jgi:hypothetical protein